MEKQVTVKPTSTKHRKQEAADKAAKMHDTNIRKIERANSQRQDRRARR